MVSVWFRGCGFVGMVSGRFRELVSTCAEFRWLVQCAAFRWTTSQGGTLGARLARAGFGSESFQKIFDTLMAAQAKDRADLQNYECFPDMLSASVWGQVLSNQPFNAKFVSLMVHLERLG